jgi:hypothetical protein
LTGDKRGIEAKPLALKNRDQSASAALALFQTVCHFLRFIGKIPQFVFLVRRSENVAAKRQSSFCKVLLAGAVTAVTVEAKACEGRLQQADASGTVSKKVD